MAASINRMTNCNVYLDGNSLLGKAEEITLPEIKAKLAEHKALGMVGAVELPSGLDKMEAQIKWAAYYTDAIAASGNIYRTVQLQVRSSLESYEAAGRTAETPVVVHLTGQFKNLPLGNFKQHDNVDFTSQMNVTYVKVVIGGVTIVELDVLANIYKVDGTDLLETYRANLGV